MPGVEMVGRWAVEGTFFPSFTYLLMLFCALKSSGAQKNKSLQNLSFKTQPIISAQINPKKVMLMSCLHLMPI